MIARLGRKEAKIEEMFLSKMITALVNESCFSYLYISTGIYVEIRGLSNLRFQIQEEITRLKNLWPDGLPIDFTESKDVYGALKAISDKECAESNNIAGEYQENGNGKCELNLE